MDSLMSPDASNTEKIKVKEADIIVRGTAARPYFGIKYLEIGSNEYEEGYGSYELKNVFAWLDEYFEIVKEGDNT